MSEPTDERSEPEPEPERGDADETETEPAPERDEEDRGARRDRRPRNRRRRPLGRRVAAIVRRVEQRAAQTDRRRILVPVYLLRLLMQVIRQWARDRCPQQAASLAFQTVLSVVPAMAVSLAALRATDNLEAESSLIKFMSARLLPFSAEAISEKLQSWSENVTFESLGLVGLVTTIILAFVMFNSLERVLNYIWRVERRRSIAQKFVVFYASATIGPFLIALSVYQASRVGLTTGFTGYALSFLASFAALFLANFFLPATPVRPLPAAVGALLTTVLFDVAKYGFSIYVAGFASAKYTGIYGAVAIVPLLLVWIYWSWLVLLLGAEVAHALQNIHWLERIERRGQMSLEKELLQRVNGPVAARLMVAICESYIHGRKVTSRRSLADRFDLSDDAIDRIAERLKEADLVLEAEGDQVGLIPAKPPREITLADVLNVFRSADVEDEDNLRHADPIDVVLREIDAETRARTEVLTLDQLIGPDPDGEDKD